MENGGEAKEVDWDEVKTIFKGLDKDGDRSVEWEEFFVRIFLCRINGFVSSSHFEEDALLPGSCLPVHDRPDHFRKGRRSFLAEILGGDSFGLRSGNSSGKTEHPSQI